MPKSNYDGGFPNGMTVRNMPIVTTQVSDSNTYWVDNSHALSSDHSKGRFTHPLKTLRKAIELCEENNGDVIYVAAGHSESITSTLNVDKAGIHIIGMSHGDSTPTFTSTQNGLISVFQVSAANVYVTNLKLVCDAPSNSYLVSVSAKNVMLEDLKLDAYTYAPLHFVNLTLADHNETDGVTLRRVKVFSDPTMAPAFYATSGFYLYQDTINVLIEDCEIFGFFNAAAVLDPNTSHSVKNIIIRGGVYHNLYTDIPTFNASKFVSGYIGRDVSVINVDESDPSLTFHVNKIGRGVNGDLVIFQIIISSSNITTSGYAFTNAIYGKFLVEDIGVETDGTGLATATALIVEKSGTAYGDPTLFSENVTSLGPNKTVFFADVTGTAKNGTVVGGDTLRVRATGANATGGNIKLTLILRVVADGSGISKV